MAAVAVSVDNSRVAVGTIATDTGTWGNDGGGGGISDEPDIVYQTTTAQSRKVSTSVIGRDYTHGSGTDMDGTPANRAHYIAKINATNSTALLARTSPALHLKIGSSSANYDTYYLFGNDNYPPRGGWQIVAVAPSVAGYRDATTGTPPTRSAILYWSLLGDFSATSKAENVVIDAIDVGLGLGLVGGDGADPDGVFADFVAFDQGTTANRYGYCYTEGPVLFFTGQIAIGQTATGTSTLTVFNDTGRTVVWKNGLVTTGFHRFKIDTATASTDIDFANCSFLSQGKVNNDGDRGYTTTEDSRPILDVTGAAAGATATWAGCVFDNFASLNLLLSCTLTDCVVTDSGQIDLGTGAVFTGATVSGYTGAADSSNIIWNVNLDTSTKLDNLTITKGTNAHHAIELGTSSPTAVTLNGIAFSGFTNTIGDNAAPLYIKRTSGQVTVNIIGCTGITADGYKTDGADVVIQSTVTLKVTVKDKSGNTINDVQTAIYKDSDGTELMNEDTVSGIASESVNIAGGTAVTVRCRKGSPAATKYIPVSSPQVTTATGLDITITMEVDPNNAS